MALTEETLVDKIEVVNQGDFSHIQVRTATIIKRDGVEISRSFHRHVVSPDHDCCDECEQVQGIAALIHTDACKAAYAAHLANSTPA